MLLALLVAPLPSATPSAAETDVGQASVIDGDTIEIQGVRIRLHGIDAPESSQTCRRDGSDLRCGQQAALALADRIGQRTVRCDVRDVDRYGRSVAVCSAGGEDLNAWMVASGLAMAYVKYARDYRPQEEEARRRGLGIWSTEFTPPWDWRRGVRLGGATPQTASVPTLTASGGDRDCGDFATHAQAQAFFEAAGPGDPHRLDRDQDRIACESLP